MVVVSQYALIQAKKYFVLGISNSWKLESWKMDNSTLAIIFENIRKNYSSLKVLKGITGGIKRGEVVAVIGASGCGKSTLLRCFNCLESIDSGRLLVNGIDISRDSLSNRQLRQLRTQIGMVFQHFNLFHHLSVLENLTLAPRKVLGKSAKESTQLARLYLDKVGLFDKASAYPEQLSGGQKQRVAIARSLCMKPQIMLFDEPTSALDPEVIGEVLQVIQQLASDGMTMVVVTHEIQFAREVANRVMFLDKGIVVEQGPAQKVLLNPETERLCAFLSRLKVNN